MNQSIPSSPNTSITLNQGFFRNQSSKNTAASITPDGSPRKVENGMEIIVPAKISPRNEEYGLRVDIKNSDVFSTVSFANISTDCQDPLVQRPLGFLQRMRERNERMILMTQKAKKENSEVLEMIKTECSKIRTLFTELKQHVRTDGSKSL